MNEDEQAVDAWLRNRGYDPEYEPNWLPKGRRPDFWATSARCFPSELWIEVKRIDHDDTMASLSKYHDLIQQSPIPAGLRGHAHIFIEPGAVEQSVRAVLRLFTQHASRHTSESVRLVLIQQGRSGTDIRRIEVSGGEPTVLFARGVGQGPMHVPAGACRDSFAPARVWYADGRIEEGPIYKFVEWTGGIECALTAHIDPSSSMRLESIASFSAGNSQGSSRVLNALEQANSQIKRACQTKPAPGLVILRPHGFLDDTQVAIAAYGKLTVPLHVRRTPTANGAIDSSVTQGEPYHGEDGVFRSTKNRHISAAVRMGREGLSSYFRNPFAHHMISGNATIFEQMVEAMTLAETYQD